MVSAHVFRNALLTAGLAALIALATRSRVGAQEAQQNGTTIILEGRVVMPDGTPPPKSVGIERVCSDLYGSAPGPLTDKKGHYIWSQRLSAATLRACFIRASLPGFLSTSIDYGDLKLEDFTSSTQKKEMPDMVLSPRDSGAPNSVALVDVSDVPGKAQAPYKLASKALDSENYNEGINQLQLACKAVPKFADGWNILGSLYERVGNLANARDALQHAIETNPKMPSPYLRLARISNKLGEWDAAAKNEDALIKIEPRFYPEIYLHQAITRFEQKNLQGAEESIKMGQSLDAAHKLTRSEYVLGRIDLAKGDIAGAKEHIGNYINLDRGSPDISKIDFQLQKLGTPDAPKTEIDLERP